MKNVKVAVIGCGYWGKNLARNFKELGALAAIVDNNPETAEHHSKIHDVPAMGLESVLADSTIRGVVIAVPAELHKVLAMQVIAAGKHVYVEKPLALSVADGVLMRDAAQLAGVKIMVGHLLQYHPVFVALRNLVNEGELGKIRYAYSTRVSMGKFRLEEDTFWSLAPHDVSMILALFNEEPHGVRRSGLDFITPGIVDESRIDMDFASGGRAHIFTSWLHPFKEQKLVVVGKKAMAVFEDTQLDWDKKLALYRHGIDMSGSVPKPIKADVEYIAVPNGEPLKNECQHFLDSIANDTTPFTDVNEALRVLRVLEAPNFSLI